MREGFEEGDNRGGRGESEENREYKGRKEEKQRGGKAYHLRSLFSLS
jgi:hypothetical protein